MNELDQKARNLMEEGWRAREDLEFPKAKKLLTEAKNLFIELNDWYNVTECLNHLSYLAKLKSAKILSHGAKLTKKAEKISKKYNTKIESVLRAQMSLYSAQGNFEVALKVAQKLFDKTEKPANKADVLQHMAFFYLRTGNITLAQESILKAEELLTEGWEQEKDPHRSIWKVSIMLTKSLLFYNLGDIKQAKSICEEALKIATAKDLKTKITQAENLLKLLKK